MPPLSSASLCFHPTLPSCLSAVRFPPLRLCRRFSRGCTLRFSSLRRCSPCRCQERWAGRKPWQVSFCRAPSSPLPACPGMGAFRWRTRDVSVCFVVCLCAYVRVAAAAAQSQNWPSRIRRWGSCPPHFVLPRPSFTSGFVPLPCAYSWWYVLMSCCVWIP